MARFASRTTTSQNFDSQALSSSAEKSPHKAKVSIQRNLQNRGSMQAQCHRKLARGARGAEGRPEAGKKRDARGKVRNGKDDQAALLNEILELGGTAGDLDLVASVASDEDGILGDRVSPAKVEREFAIELSQFVSDLGIKGDSNGGLVATSIGENEFSSTHEQDRRGTADYIVAKSINSASRDNIEDKKHSSVTHLMFDARPDWHAVELAALPAPIILDTSPFQESITDLKNYALFLLEADGNSYALKHSSSSSYGFISTILSTGTLGDRVSALTLVVQESPVHTTKYFEILCGLAKKRGRSQAMVALEAIKDLLGAGAVLPGDRRLFHFGNQPGLLGVLQRDKITCWKQGSSLPRGITKKHMILWAYEDWLKNAYFNVLKVVEVWCNDEVEFARSRAVTYVYELLREKPEQESNLLRLLVNKLGDPDRKIASRTSYLILQLQIIHPLMKSVIIRAIENEVLLRSGQNLYAKYHAINTLNQTILSVKEEVVTRKLLDIYFDLFMALLGTTSEAIVGPQAHQQALKKRSGRVKAGVLKGTAKDVGQSASVITEKLISAILTGVNRALPYAKSDDMTFQTHMDSLFAITHSSNFNTSIQALMLIQQLTASRNIAVDRFYRTLYESLLDPRLTSSSKHAMFLNLLFKALRSDLNVKRVKAFVKRLVQVITFHQPPFICGALYLLKELEATFPGLRSLLENAEECDDGCEKFFDVPDGIAVFSSQTQPLRDNLDLKHRDVDFGAKKANTYDARKRDPEHSNADKSCLWELLPFAAHFHPSVSIFASRLLNSSDIPAKPDLASHTLIHFLDRFVYRNAKTITGGLRGSSIMQPAAGSESRDVLISSRLTLGGYESLNSESFWRKKAGDVSVDEVFFHSYFRKMGKGKQAPSKKDKLIKPGLDIRSEDADENEEEIWQALARSQQEAEDYNTDDGHTDTLEPDDFVNDSPDASDLETGAENSNIASTGGFDDGVLMDWEWKNEYDVKNPSDNGLRKQSIETSFTQGKESRSKRRKLKNLPTFASIEDYAEILSKDGDEDI